MIRTRKNQKRIAALAAMLMLVGVLAGCVAQPKEQGIPVRVLILPKFEAGELTGDFPGEAQLFYEAYLAGGEVYEINGHPEPGKLYYKDGVAMYLLGQGKVSAALNTTAVLSDPRFDFSDAYILPVGCGGFGIQRFLCPVHIIMQVMDPLAVGQELKNSLRRFGAHCISIPVVVCTAVIHSVIAAVARVAELIEQPVYGLRIKCLR